jgi:hypothetical protein
MSKKINKYKCVQGDSRIFNVTPIHKCHTNNGYIVKGYSIALTRMSNQYLHKHSKWPPPTSVYTLYDLKMYLDHRFSGWLISCVHPDFQTPKHPEFLVCGGKRNEIVPKNHSASYHVVEARNLLCTGVCIPNITRGWMLKRTHTHIYIYIYIYNFSFLAVALLPNAGHGLLLILEVSSSLTTTHHQR